MFIAFTYTHKNFQQKQESSIIGWILIGFHLSDKSYIRKLQLIYTATGCNI
jgi:hypothetical protein